MPLNLPIPRHAERLPPHIGKPELARIRQAAYTLPQVVKPADYVAEGSHGFEQQDQLGYVLLQKPVAGARPSRWIAPDLIDAALAHLDAVGAGPEVRALMTERGNALQALGVARQAGRWTRLFSHALNLDDPPWTVPVHFKLGILRIALSSKPDVRIDTTGMSFEKASNVKTRTPRMPLRWASSAGSSPKTATAFVQSSFSQRRGTCSTLQPE